MRQLSISQRDVLGGQQASRGPEVEHGLRLRLGEKQRRRGWRSALEERRCDPTT